MNMERQFEVEVARARRMVEGESQALEDFYQEFLEPLYRFIYFRVGRDPHRTADLLQDTMVQVMESIHRYQGRSSLFTWICGIAKNQIRDFSRELVKDVKIAEEIMARLTDAFERHPVEEAGAGSEETRELVNRVLTTLPPRYQTCLVQKYLHDRSVREIALELQTSEKSVESMLTRARESFRVAVGDLKQEGYA